MSDEYQAAPSCALAIFGATGDLMRRLIVPALCNLARIKVLPEQFDLIGVAYDDQDTESFRRTLGERVAEVTPDLVDTAEYRQIAERLQYVRGDFDDPGTYERLGGVLAGLKRDHDSGANAIFYLATPPAAFAPIVERLAAAGLMREPEGGWRRVIVEKPFGTDLASAQGLNRRLLKAAAASTRSIASTITSARKRSRTSWCCGSPTASSSRSGTASTSTTCRSRSPRRSASSSAGKFYDATGALRDMVPNHLFQLLALIAMEPPTCFDCRRGAHGEGQGARRHAASAARRVARWAVRGQYGAGRCRGSRPRAIGRHPTWRRTRPPRPMSR